MTTTARVTLTLEISLSTTWSASVMADQVKQQAIEAAHQRLRELMRGNARIIGEPKVVAVFTDL